MTRFIPLLAVDAHTAQFSRSTSAHRKFPIYPRMGLWPRAALDPFEVTATKTTYWSMNERS